MEWGFSKGVEGVEDQCPVDQGDDDAYILDHYIAKVTEYPYIVNIIHIWVHRVVILLVKQTWF